MKAARVAEKRQMRNKSVRSATKTAITKAEKLIASDDLESAQKAVTTSISTLDRAAKKRVIHPNTAARRKSRLVRRLNKAVVEKSAVPEPVESTESVEKEAEEE
jgi:small subunit ribosomal protein S20